jgi:anti-sigma28 factor (negative regulator of flagellin synthesis)
VRDLDSLLVERLRESVARGEYRVDAKRVARKLIAARGL